MKRPGVAQVQHSHIFLGPLVMLLREQLPSLTVALEAASARKARHARATGKECRPLRPPRWTLRNWTRRDPLSDRAQVRV